MVMQCKKSNCRGEKGFTIIELLLVILVIAILTLIALPQFQMYRQRSYNAAAIADLKNLRTDLEAYFADNFQYPN